MCTIQNFTTLSPLFASVTATLTKMTRGHIHGQVRGGHKICWKHFYPKAKDAAVASFDGGIFVLIQCNPSNKKVAYLKVVFGSLFVVSHG